MNREDAKKVANEYNLVTSKQSHEILRAIQKDASFDNIFLPENINVEQLEKIKLLYQKKKKELEKSYKGKTYPSNLPFYLILEEKYPTFSWKILGTETNTNTAPNVNIDAPRVDNLRPSLFSLLINDIRSDTDTSLHRRYPIVSRLPTPLTSSLAQLLEDIQAISPDVLDMEKIVGWLEKGLQGEPLTLFSPVCPDYSVEKLKEGPIFYRYTFNELGSGVGLVAKHLLKILPFLSKTFKKYSLKVTIIVGVGDFEAANLSNVRKVNLTFEEFLSRLQKSRAAIQISSKAPIQTVLFTDLCGGFQGWNAHLKKFERMFAKKEYGYSNLTSEKLLSIIKARKPLYDRWYGIKSHLEDYLPMLLRQGAEYAAMGAILKEKYRNCLILGADHAAMKPFYNVDHIHPILYLKRFYI